MNVVSLDMIYSPHSITKLNVEYDDELGNIVINDFFSAELKIAQDGIRTQILSQGCS